MKSTTGPALINDLRLTHTHKHTQIDTHRRGERRDRSAHRQSRNEHTQKERREERGEKE